MQVIGSSNRPVVPGICDPNKSRAQHHLSMIPFQLHNGMLKVLACHLEQIKIKTNAVLFCNLKLHYQNYPAL